MLTQHLKPNWFFRTSRSVRYHYVAALFFLAFALFSGCASSSDGHRDGSKTSLPTGDTKATGSQKKRTDPELYAFLRITPLHLAAEGGQISTAKRILDAGANIDAVCVNSTTPLIRAAAAGHLTMVMLLFERGASLDYGVPNHDTALIAATDANREPVVSFLLSKGAALEKRGPAGATALMTAAQRGHDNLCQLLIKAGAKLEATNRFGDNAVSIALMEHQLAAAKVLVNAGSVYEPRGDSLDDRFQNVIFRKYVADKWMAEGKVDEARRLHFETQERFTSLRKEFSAESTRLEKEAEKKAAAQRRKELWTAVLMVVQGGLQGAAADYNAYHNFKSCAQITALRNAGSTRQYYKDYRSIMGTYGSSQYARAQFTYTSGIGSPQSLREDLETDQLRPAAEELKDNVRICDAFLAEIGKTLEDN